MFKQKVELLEAMSGCETANTYKIYDVADNGKQNGNFIKKKKNLFNFFTNKGDEIFKVKEKSECCSRVCCPGNCRPFELKLKDKLAKDSDDDILYKVEREFACTFLCCSRYYLILMVC